MGLQRCAFRTASNKSDDQFRCLLSNTNRIGEINCNKGQNFKITKQSCLTDKIQSLTHLW